MFSLLVIFSFIPLLLSAPVTPSTTITYPLTFNITHDLPSFNNTKDNTTLSLKSPYRANMLVHTTYWTPRNETNEVNPLNGTFYLQDSNGLHNITWTIFSVNAVVNTSKTFSAGPCSGNSLDTFNGSTTIKYEFNQTYITPGFYLEAQTERTYQNALLPINTEQWIMPYMISHYFYAVEVITNGKPVQLNVTLRSNNTNVLPASVFQSIALTTEDMCINPLESPINGEAGVKNLVTLNSTSTTISVLFSTLVPSNKIVFFSLNAYDNQGFDNFTLTVEVNMFHPENETVLWIATGVVIGVFLILGIALVIYIWRKKNSDYTQI